MSRLNQLDTLTFGKYKGKSLEEIVIEDYKYIIWLKDNNITEISDNIYNSALEQEYGYEEPTWGDWHDMF